MRKFLCISVLALLPCIALAHALPIEITPPPDVHIIFSEATVPSLTHVVTTHDEHGVTTVTWQAVSEDDGHFSRGSYRFGTGTTTQSNHSHAADPQTVASFFELLGNALMMGALLLLRDDPRQKKVGLIGAGLALAGNLALIALISSDVGPSTSLGASSMTYWSTHPGLLTSMRGFLALLAGLAFASDSLAGAWVLTLLWAFARASLSHAAAQAFLPELSVFLMFIHIAAKNALMGISLFRGRKFFAPLVLIGATSGAYIVSLHLKHLSNLFTTDWGRLCTLLLVTGAAYLASHVFRRRIDESGTLEAVLALAILYLTSMIIVTTPTL